MYLTNYCLKFIYNDLVMFHIIINKTCNTLCSNPLIYWARFTMSPEISYNVPLCVTPISCFTIEHDVLKVPPIYRTFLLSPEKHSKLGDYCSKIYL